MLGDRTDVEPGEGTQSGSIDGRKTVVFKASHNHPATTVEQKDLPGPQPESVVSAPRISLAWVPMEASLDSFRLWRTKLPRQWHQDGPEMQVTVRTVRETALSDYGNCKVPVTRKSQETTFDPCYRTRPLQQPMSVG